MNTRAKAFLPLEAILSKAGESWVVGGVASNFFKDLDGDAISPAAIQQAIPGFMANRGPDGIQGGPLRLHHGFWERFLKQAINGLSLPYDEQIRLITAIALPLGRVTEMSVDADGTTRWRGVLSQANPIARVIWDMLREGMIHLGVSVGGKIHAVRPGRDALGRPCNVITSVRLDELSITDNPANRLIESESPDNGAYIMALAKSLTLEKAVRKPSPGQLGLFEMPAAPSGGLRPKKSRSQGPKDGDTKPAKGKAGGMLVFGKGKWRRQDNANKPGGLRPKASQPARSARALAVLNDDAPAMGSPKQKSRPRADRNWQSPKPPAAMGGRGMAETSLRPKPKPSLPEPLTLGNDDIFERNRPVGEPPKHYLVDVADIKPSKPASAFDPQEIESLAQSILESGGLLKPVALQENGPMDYSVLSGDLEYHAAARAKQINPRAAEMVSAFVVPPSHKEEAMDQLALRDQLSGASDHHQDARVRDPRYYLVDVADIKPSKPASAFDQREIESLAQSILATGQLLSPLVVQENGPMDYSVLSGDLEYYAAARAKQLDPRAAEMVSAFVAKPNPEQTPVSTPAKGGPSERASRKKTPKPYMEDQDPSTLAAEIDKIKEFLASVDAGLVKVSPRRRKQTETYLTQLKSALLETTKVSADIDEMSDDDLLRELGVDTPEPTPEPTLGEMLEQQQAEAEQPMPEPEPAPAGGEAEGEGEGGLRPKAESASDTASAPQNFPKVTIHSERLSRLNGLVNKADGFVSGTNRASLKAGLRKMTEALRSGDKTLPKLLRAWEKENLTPDQAMWRVHQYGEGKDPYAPMPGAEPTGQASDDWESKLQELQSVGKSKTEPEGTGNSREKLESRLRQFRPMSAIGERDKPYYNAFRAKVVDALNDLNLEKLDEATEITFAIQDKQDRRYANNLIEQAAEIIGNDAPMPEPPEPAPAEGKLEPPTLPRNLRNETGAAFLEGFNSKASKNPYYLSSTYGDAWQVGRYMAENGITGVLEKKRNVWTVDGKSYKVDMDDVMPLGADGKPEAKAKPPKAESTAATTTGNAAMDEWLSYYEALSPVRKEGLTSRDKKSYERLKKAKQADPKKWNVGDNVSYRLPEGGQINRGFRIVSVDPDTKTVRLKMTRDTGLTETGGNEWISGTTEVHIVDLQRDNSGRKRNLKKTGTIMGNLNSFLAKALGGSPGRELTSGSWQDTTTGMGRGLGAPTSQRPQGSKQIQMDNSSSAHAGKGIGGKQPKAQRPYSSGGMPPTDVWGMTMTQLTRELAKCSRMDKEAWGSPETVGFLTDSAHAIAGITDSPHAELVNFVRFLQNLGQFAQALPHMDDYQAAGTVVAMNNDLTKALDEFVEKLPSDLKGQPMRPPGSPGVVGLDIQFPTQYIVYS